VARALRRYPRAYIEAEHYPERFIQIADSACQLALELDPWTGTLYEGWCGRSVHEHYARQGLPPPPDSEELNMQQISYLAPSLEDWITTMLDSGREVVSTGRQWGPLEQWMLEE
jgi:hypothetical protein